jgi:hypothetical protein
MLDVMVSSNSFFTDFSDPEMELRSIGGKFCHADNPVFSTDFAGFALHLVAPARIVDAQIAEKIIRLVVGRLAEEQPLRLQSVTAADVRMHAEQSFFNSGDLA